MIGFGEIFKKSVSRNAVTYRFLDDDAAKEAVSSMKDRLDNPRLNTAQFEKYYDDPKKKWFGCFYRGECMALSVLKHTPQSEEEGIRDVMLMAEVQSAVRGFGRFLIEEILSRYPSVWWAADAEGGEKLLEYYRGFVEEHGLSELKLKKSVWWGKPQSIFWRAEDGKRKDLMLKEFESFELG